MSVVFFPPKPIELLENFIQKEDGAPLYGEIEVYRKIANDLSNSCKNWWVWHDLRLPFHSNIANPLKKTNCQIDFLILCDEGILILEVKGGPISFKGNQFYYGKNYEKPLTENPFNQAQGYKFTIKDKVLKTGTNIFLCHAIVFPHSDKSFDNCLFDTNILWTRELSTKYNNSFENFFLAVYKYSKTKHENFKRNFNNLSQIEIDKIKKILAPIVNDNNPFYTDTTYEWLKVSNLEILEGLERNDRIMIEGGPGTGKTTFAKAFIDRQYYKKGLYLCWNNFLMQEMKHIITDRRISGFCEITTFLRFIIKLNPTMNLNKLLSANDKDYIHIVSEAILKAKSNNSLPIYDYIIIDEGQDILEKGIDLVMNEVVGFNSDGIINGRILFLFDLAQAYFAENKGLVELSDTLLSYFAHFRLNENKRSAQNPSIRALGESLLSNEMIDAELFDSRIIDNSVSVIFCTSFEEIKKNLVKDMLTPLRNLNSSLKGKDCILLIESSILKLTEKGLSIKELLIIKDVEELTEENLNDTANKLRYTTILKYKGLEKTNVILLIEKPSQINRYEIYIGITRAICNLYIIVYDNTRQGTFNRLPS